ncbi:restriction endonuclease subunit S [Parabacteroides distasonis]|uniref:restriction endonuclease subunit S n=1 Tax=Parabacteroides distasonis TaxID=823 RepID=UPI002331022C|nr:restriction endonuclease subunit S [Parabacteroides distasonis]MDB9008835.1 restriction endonuclease subunit S [Parabacteroides distasonis]
MDTKKLRQKILDLAIHGKLVPQDPNDEPASVLLEHIKAEKERLIKEGKIKGSKKSAKASDMPHYEQVKLEVPNSWYMVSVSDLFLLNPKSELEDNMKVGFIPMALVEDGFSGNHFYEERTWKDVKRGYCHFQNGDIGIAKISPCFENRKSTIFKNLPNTYGAGTTELVILRPIKVYTKFYLYLFKSDWYVKEGTKYFKGVVGQQRVHKEIFTDLHIPLPPFAEQQRIVEEIEYWFALIDQIEQDKSDLQTAIRQTKSKILDLAIHGKLVPQNPNDEPASELLKRINPKAEITCDNGHYPVGWIDVILGDIFYHNTGKALNSSNKEGVLRNYLTTSNVYWNQFDLSLVKQMPFRDNELEKCTVQKGDLLVCEGGDVGRSAIWNFDYNICIQNHIHRLRPKGDLNVSFYYYVLRFLKEHNRIGGKGIGLLGLSSNELHKIGMPLPPRKEQDRIVLKIEELFSVLDNIENALEA